MTAFHGLALLAGLVRGAPWRCALAVAGLGLATVATWALLALHEAPSARSGPPATLRLSRGDGVGDGLEVAQLDLLRGALPAHRVGGARALVVAELAPPVLAVDDLAVLAADPSWLALEGLEVELGRALADADEVESAAVCLVSSRLASALDRGADPIGHHLRLDATWLTVVGRLAPPSDGRPSPDVVLPLSSGLRRLAAGGEGGLDEVLVEDRGAMVGLPGLVGRVLARSRGGGDLLPSGGGDASGLEAPLRILAALIAGLGLLAGGALLDGLPGLPQGRGARASALATLGLLLSSPGLLLVSQASALIELARGELVPPGPALALLALVPAVLLGAALGARGGGASAEHVSTPRTRR